MMGTVIWFLQMAQLLSMRYNYAPRGRPGQTQKYVGTIGRRLVILITSSVIFNQYLCYFYRGSPSHLGQAYF